ncbi:DgaE family pyridoxal phosphate-dependent ammonia lyase [Lactobacillus helsingborgensis]|uniref:DgaE family pyridoxal phosphate-dependent ammonia lyase n=1 Tax=Lactobacillus helsingborgensis TaxID=1218494 RepID=UPI002264B716|nr:DgaE family pyridoxal phosphate-dependent ammonia lyase [Lactobacillus helsingborgensis]UZX32104.1 DgaE family pyridoxal phosphate-dependent ammonia lyase [Lactobacillus helsingborgensis]
MDFYQKLNLKKVINASGKMTILGVSKVTNESIAAQQFGDQHFFEMTDLIEKSGKYIAEMIGAEDALIVNSASAGIAQAVAGIIGQGSEYHLYHPYTERIIKRNIILPKGQNIDYGTPEEEMIALGGGHPVEAGYANTCSDHNLEIMIDENTAAILYVKSHHCVQKSMLTIKEALKVAHEHNLPLILDAAAEEDIKTYVDLGVDVIIFSGAKAIAGPASGLILGKKKYINWARMQAKGIGRAMKIGKENILGLTAAFENYVKCGPENGENMKKRLSPFISALSKLPHVSVTQQKDQAGRDIYRADMKIDPSFSKNAITVIKELKEQAPVIYTREYRANENIIEFDIRAIDNAEMKTIVKRLQEILK